MNMNLQGGPSKLWKGWEYLYEYGVRFGWEPVGPRLTQLESGTWVPTRDSPEVGEWFGISFEIEPEDLTHEDAQNWADALERGFSEIGRKPCPKELEFIRFLRQGGGILAGKTST